MVEWCKLITEGIVMSTLTIELDSATENGLQRLSLNEGRKQEEVAAALIANSLRNFSSLGLTEAQILQRINVGWAETKWRRYHELVEIRKADSLTDAEYQELTNLTNEREVAHSERLRLALELARIWNVSWESALSRLGIGNLQNVDPLAL